MQNIQRGSRFAVQCCKSKQVHMMEAPDNLMALEMAKRLRRVHPETKLADVRCLDHEPGSPQTPQR